MEEFDSNFYKAFFESTPEGVLVTDGKTKRFLLANQKASKITGYSVNEIKKLSVSDLHQKKDLKFVVDQFTKQMRGEIALAKNIPILRKDKRIIFCDFNTQTVKIGGRVFVAGFFRDATERKHSEEELHKFKLGIEKAEEAIFITDREGIFTYANPAFEKSYGYTMKEITGKTPRILKSGTISKRMYENLWETLISKKSIKIDLVNKTKKGKLVTVEESVSPILSETGDILGFLSIQRDVTERKKFEEDLKSKNAELERFNKIAVGRELKMIDLKSKVKELESQLAKVKTRKND